MESLYWDIFVLVQNADTGKISQIPIYMTAWQRIQQKFLSTLSYRTADDFYFSHIIQANVLLHLLIASGKNTMEWILSLRNFCLFFFIGSPNLTGNVNISVWSVRNSLPWHRITDIISLNTAWNKTKKLFLIKNLLYYKPKILRIVPK